MDVLAIPGEGSNDTGWAEGLGALGFMIVIAVAWPPDTTRPAAIVILDRPAPDVVEQRLAALTRHPALSEAVVLIRADDAADDGIGRICRLSGAFPLTARAAPDECAAFLLLALRLWGESARRRTLEDDRQHLEAERLALQADRSHVLEPFIG